ncbi:hypothetical protein ES708_27179 [subsurface metagenome]
MYSTGMDTYLYTGLIVLRFFCDGNIGEFPVVHCLPCLAVAGYSLICGAGQKIFVCRLFKGELLRLSRKAAELRPGNNVQAQEIFPGFLFGSITL